MKKIVKLTESDLMNIIKRVINESVPMSASKSPCPGQRVCFGSANTAIGCCPVGYACNPPSCVRNGTYGDLAVSNSTSTVKEAISTEKDKKRKCICDRPGEVVTKEFPCECSIPMTPANP